MNLKYIQKVTISFAANIFRRSRSHYQLPLKTKDISREDGKHQKSILRDNVWWSYLRKKELL
jgi:hypothetical protein